MGNIPYTAKAKCRSLTDWIRKDKTRTNLEQKYLDENFPAPVEPDIIQIDDL